jgi:hypothetical protein
MDLTKNQEIMMAKELVSILSYDRSVDYKSWSKVGFCLGNIDKSLHKTWIKFSKRCPEKFDEGDATKLFAIGYKYDITMGSLRYWAEQDSPVKYKAIITKYKYISKHH